jgi:hypothetical protein
MNGNDENIMTDKLKSENASIRIEAVKSLADKMPDKNIKKILIAHYKSLPIKRVPGWLKAEMERKIIIEAVGNDKSPESERFLADVLKEEYENILNEEKNGSVSNLPVIVRQTVTKFVMKNYSDSKIIIQPVDELLKSELRFVFKQDLMAIKILYVMNQIGIIHVYD